MTPAPKAPSYELVERVALALARHDEVLEPPEDMADGVWQEYLEAAQAALAALKPGDDLGDRKLVSRSFTEDWKAHERKAVTEFCKAILHGDEHHRQWLTEAGEAFCAGDELPAPKGMGTAARRAAEATRERCCDKFDELLCAFLAGDEKEASFDDMIAQVRNLPLEAEE